MAVKKIVEAAPAAAETAVVVPPAAAQPEAQAAKAAPVAAAEPVTPSETAPAASLAAPQADLSNKIKMETVMKTTEEFVTFGQGNVEAFVKASQIWAAGMQDISKQFAATAQAQVDQTVATFKALAGVKSIKEAMDLQSTLARSSVEKAVSDTGKLTDASLKLTEQAFAPITARVTLAMEKFGRTA